jgi:hypothetical protein
MLTEADFRVDLSSERKLFWVFPALCFENGNLTFLSFVQGIESSRHDLVQKDTQHRTPRCKGQA